MKLAVSAYGTQLLYTKSDPINSTYCFTKLVTVQNKNERELKLPAATLDILNKIIGSSD